MRRLVQMWGLAAVLVVLVGCVTQPVADVYTGRTFPEAMIDSDIEQAAMRQLVNIDGLPPGNYRVAVNAYDGEVLLTGEVPSENTRNAVAAMVSKLRNVKKVYDYLKISSPKSQSHTVQEGYLKAKLSSKLLLNPELQLSQYTLVVRDDVLYVMGILTEEQVNVIQQATTSTDGFLGFVWLNTLLKSQP